MAGVVKASGSMAPQTEAGEATTGDTVHTNPRRSKHSKAWDYFSQKQNNVVLLNYHRTRH